MISNLAEYYQYELKQSVDNPSKVWANYQGERKSIFSGPGYLFTTIRVPGIVTNMLNNHHVSKYPWLNDLFKLGKLSALVAARHSLGLTVNYVDYFGPGTWEAFGSDIPDAIAGVSLMDGNNISAPAEFRERTTRIHANIYDIRTVARLLRGEFISKFGLANITTETAVGPFWRFGERDLIQNFDLGMVWANYELMFRTAYNFTTNEGGLMLIQIPNINSRNLQLPIDAEIEGRYVQYLNELRIPTMLYGDMMISIKTDQSPTELPRLPI